MKNKLQEESDLLQKIMGIFDETQKLFKKYELTLKVDSQYKNNIEGTSGWFWRKIKINTSIEKLLDN